PTPLLGTANWWRVRQKLQFGSRGRKIATAVPSFIFTPFRFMKCDVVLFDAAETLFTTRGSVGEIYGDAARRFGCTTSSAEIQAAFVRQFRHSGPLTTDNEKQWWKDVVQRVFSDVGMVSDFDRFFDDVYEHFRDNRGWKLFPETLDVLKELHRLQYKLGIIS